MWQRRTVWGMSANQTVGGYYMKYRKIYGFLISLGKKLQDFAEHLGISKQQLSNKKNTDAFSADDLIMLADLTNTTLALVDKNGKIVLEFSKEDLSKK